MHNNPLSVTRENEDLNKKLKKLQLDFVDLFTRHKDMVEHESVMLISLYLSKFGGLQLTLLEKQTEAARLKMKINLVQAAINRDEKPDLDAIEQTLNDRLQAYYHDIQIRIAELEEAQNVLSHLMSEEDTIKLKEIFRVLCKRLHPDLNPLQSEEDKDLFIKVKVAYELRRLVDLQHILLYLDDAANTLPATIPPGEKQDHIQHLEENIQSLQAKVDALLLSFPFNQKELIYDAEASGIKQADIQTQIVFFEDNILKYKKIINLICDE